MKNKKLFAILTLVCFMFTLMPVAAFAAADDLDNTRSVLFLADDQNPVLADKTGTVKYQLALRDVEGDIVNVGAGSPTKLFVWAEENGVVSPAMEIKSVTGSFVYGVNKIKNVYEFNNVDDATVIEFKFARAGEYTICAGFGADEESELKDIQRFATAAVNTTVLSGSANPEGYVMNITSGADYVNSDSNSNGKVDAIYKYKDFDSYIEKLTPNNVSAQYTLSFDAALNGSDLIGKTVTIASDSANLTVTPETAVTDTLGRVKINVSASREGVYSIYVTVDGKTFVIGVNCGNTQAAYIETVEEPDHLVALYNSADKLVTFKITDINGNAVKNAGATGNGADGIYGLSQVKYLFFTEKPAASTIVNGNLKLDTTSENGKYALRIAGKTLDAEGVYTVKAILDNGSVATASWEVKKFDKPVELLIDAPATVELGTDFDVELSYLDANGVEKTATDAKLAATGYAIYSFANKNVVVKTDEKYAGQTITLTAVSEMYDLIDVEDVKVAAEAVAVEFVDDTLAVNVNNKVEWNVVDTEGNAVTLNDVAAATVKYVVLDKPADAKVSVYDLTDKTPFTGEGEMALTSNKVGNVTVQVVVQVELKSTDATQDTLGAKQTKYYTGTEIFAVGTEDKGDVVVMSIGSNEIVKNDKVATMIAAPIVQNDRTFVPFRALAEAFGAEVAWDEATQAVTAELNGVTVVMTIGSVEYTINGEAATMDVAPFLGNDSTMVPVRFVAQAFGIKVIPTYDANGATADILFNL